MTARALRRDEALRSLGRRAAATRVVLGGYVAINLALAMAGSFATFGLARPGAMPLPIVAAVVGLLSLLMVLATIPLTITLMLWLHRARSNLVDFGLTDLAYSPGWTVGSFFVPVINWTVPFRSMRELYNRSQGEDVYQSLATVPDVSSWWTSFLAGATIQLALLGMALVGRFTNAYFTTPPLANAIVSTLSIFLLALSAFFLFRVVGAVTAAQSSTTAVAETFA